jgi:aminomethyltransferase
MTNSAGTEQKTVLYEKHERLGARFVEFGGWLMPVNYAEGIIAEHHHTRNKVSLFDICHMGEFSMSGPNAAKDLDNLTARSVITQKIGACKYNFLLNENGGVIDDIIVYKKADNDFFIVVNAGTKNSDAEWIKNHISPLSNFLDLSDETAKLDLQGPKSKQVLIELGFKDNELPLYYKFINAKIAGFDCLISRTGYTGELGYEIYINVKHATAVWDLLLSKQNIKPAGLGARDTLRLEMAYPLYGHELNTKTTPIEAGFEKLLDLSEKRNFIGKDALLSLPRKKKLAGVILDGKRAAKESSELLFNGRKIGCVSSGSYSPSLEKAIALAYIDADFDIIFNSSFEISTKKNILQACFSEIPFYRKGSAKK